MGNHSSKNQSKFTDLYEIGEEIGIGNYASVHTCHRRSDSAEFAVKIIKKKYLTPKEVCALKNEINILKYVSHENVIKLIDVFDEKKNILMVLELCEDDLLDKMSLYSNLTLCEKESAQIIYQLCNALQHIHQNGIVHRDLKLENILIAKDGNIKLTDFGLAHFTPQYSSAESDCSISSLGSQTYDCILMKTLCGTPFYVAPEVIQSSPYNFKCDMWGLGVILYIMLSGYKPFQGENLQNIYGSILKGNYNFNSIRWNKISNEAKDLIDCLLNVNPKQRYSPNQVKNHPWIRQYVK